ncbi:hypothetical protein A0H81_06103 [Grifola frondosa]|uniref:Uncharacterized protein n=1 Tax=Grifola frondosa TaxID=5627 RepID=A0A1C7MAJ7_GRIFR|nr:hypothetical protein A0H81_06103 [Grifola frondosa]
MAKPEAPGKPGPRKRGTMEETLARKAKRQKRTSKKTEEEQFNVIQQMPSVMPAPILPPFFPTFHANPHHQPYYQAYPHRPLSTPQPLPAEVIFPPLPPSSNYHRLAALSAPAAFSTSRPETPESVGRSHSSSQEMEEELLIDHACFADPLSSSSMPDLASNLSSSSSPPPSSSTSLLGLDSRGPSPDFTSGSELQYPADSQDGTDEWLSSVPSVEALEPSITLLQRLSTKKSKGKTKQSDPKKTRYQRAMSPPIPQSPTLERQAAADSRRKQSTISEPSTPPRKVVELSAPPVTPQRPSTPRRRSKGLVVVFSYLPIVLRFHTKVFT